MISTVTGKFDKLNATLENESIDLSNASITFEADVDSVNTNSEQRDGHLKADDFFAADKYPKLTFKSSQIEKETDEEFVMNSDLTIRNITHPVKLKVEYNGEMVDPWGQTKLNYDKMERSIDRILN